MFISTGSLPAAAVPNAGVVERMAEAAMNDLADSRHDGNVAERKRRAAYRSDSRRYMAHDYRDAYPEMCIAGSRAQDVSAVSCCAGNGWR